LIHFIMNQNASFRFAMHITLSAQCHCYIAVHLMSTNLLQGSLVPWSIAVIQQ